MISTDYFGEGATVLGSRAYQLTWKNGVVLVYSMLSDPPTFEREVPLPPGIKEGWGLTHDGKYLYVSNGSQTIFVYRPEPDGTLTLISRLDVDCFGNSPQFNELEMVNDTYIYANSFMTNQVYKIDKASGKLLRVWDLSRLAEYQRQHVITLG